MCYNRVYILPSCHIEEDDLVWKALFFHNEKNTFSPLCLIHFLFPFTLVFVADIIASFLLSSSMDGNGMTCQINGMPTSHPNKTRHIIQQQQQQQQGDFAK